jgi:tRNA-dihydrouridine synthase C
VSFDHEHLYDLVFTQLAKILGFVNQHATSTLLPQVTPPQALPPPRILLAPMEGMLDCVLRDILTRIGGVDSCVSEFIRVTNTLLPKRAFIRVMPELLNGGRTLAGVPVLGQLLGSDPSCLADNAAQLASLGPAGIDLNFGCPAKVVNRHGGGAMLLQDPKLLNRIVSEVRRAVPASMAVSAKMRLGYMDDLLAEECAQAIEAGGASSIVVHGRTKAHGYRPPAYWDRIADVRASVQIPIVANGEIWTVEDALRCREVSGCQDIMVGRGIVADPGLAWTIRRHDHADGRLQPSQFEPARQVDWQTIAPHLLNFWNLVKPRVIPRHRAGRLKQWLNLMRRCYPEAQTMFSALRTMNDSVVVERCLNELLAANSPASTHFFGASITSKESVDVAATALS